MKRLLISGVVAAVGCGSSSPQMPDAGSDAGMDASSAVDLDLRFQWVGAFAGYTQRQFTNVNVLLGLTLEGHYAWGPLQMTLVGLKPGGYSWRLADFTPREISPELTSVAQAKPIADMSNDVSDLLANGFVITSLDVMPDAYALVATAPVDRTHGYSGTWIETDRTGLATRAASEGLRGGVVTAVSGDGNTIRAAVFVRAGDDATYETRVLDASTTTMIEQAKSLAAGGYTVTAFGRNGDGLLLVGTRPMGRTTPRSIITQTGFPDLSTGYAIVGWVLDPAVVILER